MKQHLGLVFAGVFALAAGCGEIADRLDSAAGSLDRAGDQVRADAEAAADEGRAAISGSEAGPPVQISMEPDRVEVLDGDTIRFEGVRYRLRSADAPETLDPACPAEAEAGAAATAWVQARIGAANTVEARGFGPHWVLDRYRRRLADVLVDGDDLGVALIASGLGAPRGRGHWC